MKKIAVSLLAVLMAATVLTGCFGGNENSSSSGSSDTSSSASSTMNELMEGTSLEKLVGEVNKAFKETFADIEGVEGAVMMPMTLDEQVLKDQYGLTMDQVEEYYGEFSMSMTNSDVLVAIKAKPGKIDEVKAALEKRKADLEAQFEQYPVNGSYERAKASKVYVRGDYAFLIGVGVMPVDPEANPEFEKQVQQAQDVIDKLFK